MVELFTKRSELMPSDESIEQHTKKRAEEIAEVDKDRAASAGLFKGSFASNGRQGPAFRDEQDGVWRCPGCHHEHEGGPLCHHCGYEMDEEDYDYDLYGDILTDEADLDDLELDLDGDDVDSELDFNAGPQDPYLDLDLPLPYPPPRRRHFRARDFESVSGGSSMYSNADEDDDEDEEEAGSLQDFVAPDDEDPTGATVHQPNNPSRQQHAITISDDESDEGGAVSNRIPRRRRFRWSATPSVVTVTDSATNDSDIGDLNSEAGMLRDAGWSPLDQGNDSEAEEQYAYQGNRHHGDGYGSSDLGQSDNSDTETIGGHGGSDGDESRSREDFSQTPTYDGPPYIPHEHLPEYESLDGDADDDDSEAGSSVYDRDGDTEMSASPSAGRSITTDSDEFDEQADYPDEPRSERSTSRLTPGEPDYYTNEMYENLGQANQFRTLEEDSDDSPRPPVRRQRHRFSQDVQVNQQYDPRISRIFADHQQNLRDMQPARVVTLNGLNEDARRQNDARRRINAYRNQPPRRNDPLRSSRSPSANRIIASSSRNSRVPRQYNLPGRGYN